MFWYSLDSYINQSVLIVVYGLVVDLFLFALEEESFYQRYKHLFVELGFLQVSSVILLLMCFMVLQELLVLMVQ